MADFPNKPSTSKCDQSSSSTSSFYELTAVNGGGSSASSFVAKSASHTLQPQPMQQSLHVHRSDSRKRKLSYYSATSSYDDDMDDSKSTRSMSEKKQNHSEIEKRRRDKMNTYIGELSALIPMCGAMSRKLDKLTVLRMAVQHLRSIRGALSVCPLSASPRPTFISEQELNSLILNAAQDSFLLVIGCDRGRLLYVSTSVTRMLNYEQSELLGKSFFDILHPKDMAKVKEQLSSSDLSPRERLIDAKTMLPVKADMTAGASRLSPGARRSFFCRIKCKPSSATDNSSQSSVKEESEYKTRKKYNEKKYCVVQCTGYLKSWDTFEMGECASSSETTEDEEDSMSCLVAVGRALPDLIAEQFNCSTAPVRPIQYVSRHALDGKFTFVDQRVTMALGFLPQELLGTSLYEYISGPELAAVIKAHKSALTQPDPLITPPYLCRKKDGTHVRIQTHFKPFKNPWTKDIEFIIAKNTIMSAAQVQEYLNATSQSSYDIYKQKTDAEMQQLIETQVESHKIGSAIAEEALRRSSSEFSPELPLDILPEVFNQQSSIVDNILGMDIEYGQVRNNVTLSAACEACTPPPRTDDTYTGTPSPPLSTLGIDGNSEAAMAVIMNFLEADAGLGHSVDFPGPWPLS